MKFQGEPPSSMSGQDKNALIAAVVDRAVDTLGSEEKEDASWLEFRKVARSGQLTIEAFEKFLTDNGFKWYHVGGYAYYRWCVRFSQPLVDFGDYDVAIEQTEKALLAMYGPHRKDEQWQISGKVISIVSGRADEQRQLLDTSWVVAPTEIAKTYGSAPSDKAEKVEPEKATKWDPRKKGDETKKGNFLGDITKGGFQLKKRDESAAHRTDEPGFAEKTIDRLDEEERRKREEKELKRATRQAGLPELIKQYLANYSS